MKIAKNLLPLFALLLATPLLAADGTSATADLFSGPNLALALIAIIQLIAIISVASILKRITRNRDYFVKLKKMRENTGKVAGILVFFFAFSGQTFAQEAQRPEAPLYPEFARDPNTLLLLGLNVLLLLIFLYMTRLLRNTVSMLMPELEEEPQVVGETATEEEPSKIMHALTDAVPVEREHEVMLDHEYDGIRELDNNLPPWWVWMFYVTIFFAFVYMIYYHVLPYGMSQEEQYIAEVEEAEIARQEYLAMAKNLVDENTVEMLSSESDLAAGKSIFNTNCMQCHAADGGGGVGPNLTDDYWIHGGSVKDIFKTIKYGVPAKGMISWEAQLKPNQMAQVTSYIKTLQGTEPANPKEPQGELWVEPDVIEEDEAPEGEEMENSDEAEAPDKESDEKSQTASVK